MSTRCGIGYDLHRLAEGRKLIVGGIELPFDKGPVGHSDPPLVSHIPSSKSWSTITTSFP